MNYKNQKQYLIDGKIFDTRKSYLLFSYNYRFNGKYAENTSYMWVTRKDGVFFSTTGKGVERVGILISDKMMGDIIKSSKINKVYETMKEIAKNFNIDLSNINKGE